MHFFTADEHYGHSNIIKYCNRPFSSVDEMDGELIRKHNSVVGPVDVVIHGGDFTLTEAEKAQEYVTGSTCSFAGAMTIG